MCLTSANSQIARTDVSWQCSTAANKAERPEHVVHSREAPCCSSRAAMSPSPFSATTCRAVFPEANVALTSPTFSFSNRPVMSRKPRWQATRSGEVSLHNSSAVGAAVFRPFPGRCGAAGSAFGALTPRPAATKTSTTASKPASQAASKARLAGTPARSSGLIASAMACKTSTQSDPPLRAALVSASSGDTPVELATDGRAPLAISKRSVSTSRFLAA
mmetsp:Transcript_35609/g.93106  ORF Transcript_35609/g.93106 Transcript_35609/m.93106 type:complete len:218 (-) Transcript_35609:531-1184(-)